MGTAGKDPQLDATGGCLVEGNNSLVDVATCLKLAALAKVSLTVYDQQHSSESANTAMFSN